MRFALIATSAAAVVAIPMAASVAAPHMTRDAFVSAVRCTAYEDASLRAADLGAQKFRLNAEAAHQSEQAVREAHKAASAIARAGATAENSASPAFATEIGDDAACQADTTRQDLRSDAQSTPQSAAPVSPAPATRPVATVQRDQATGPTTHADASRRRSGKPVPDSELIAPRGAL